MLQRFFNYCFILLLIMPLCGHAQWLKKRVSIQADHVTIEQILVQLSQRYQVPFSYVRQYLPTATLSLHITEQPLSVLLDEALLGSGMGYKEMSSQIVLSTVDNTLTQTVHGVVMDKNLQIPIPGVTVQLSNLSGKGSVTDEQGRFLIPQVPLGRYDLVASSIGYKPVRINQLLVISGRQTVLPVLLEESVYETKEIRVTAQRKTDKTRSVNPLAVVSTRILSVEEANRFAGTRTDPSRMAANYAGVVNLSDQNNDIIVRGNNPFGVLWRLEGMDIPNPNHYTYITTSGGIFSVLNNNLLANSDFMTGAFPAEYGNKNASVFDIRLRKGNAEKNEFNAQVGLSGLEFNAEGPVDKKKGSTYIAGYRFLSFDFLQRLGLDITINGVPQFQDLTFKIHVPDGNNGAFVLFGLGGKSKIRFQDKYTDMRQVMNRVTDGVSYFSSDMGVLGMRYDHYFSAKTFGQILSSISGSHIISDRDIRFADKSITKDSYGNFEEKGFSFGYNLTHKFNTKHLLKTGVSFNSRRYYYFLQTLWNDTSRIHTLKLDDHVTMNMLQGFATWQFTPAPALTFNAGLHYQQLFYNSQQALEPRLSAEWRLNSKQRITAGYGLHHQMQPVNMYINRNYNRTSQTYTPANKHTAFTGSHHYVAGYENNFSPWFRLKAETYYQSIFHAPIPSSPGFYSGLNEGPPYNDYVPDTLVSKGRGRNYGVEVTLERFLHKHYYFLLTTTLYDSKYLASNGKWYNTPFNGNYILNLATGVELGVGKKENTFSVDMRVIQAGNKRILPVDVDASRKSDQVVIAEDGFYKEKLKDYRRVDVKVGYRLNRLRSSHTFFIAADNVLNRKNVLGKAYYYYEQEMKTDYQLGFFPYAGYKIEF